MEKGDGLSERRANEENPLPKGLFVSKRKPLDASVLRPQSRTRWNGHSYPEGSQTGRSCRRVQPKEGGSVARRGVSRTDEQWPSHSTEHDDAHAIHGRSVPSV